MNALRTEPRTVEARSEPESKHWPIEGAVVHNGRRLQRTLLKETVLVLVKLLNYTPDPERTVAAAPIVLFGNRSRGFA